MPRLLAACAALALSGGVAASALAQGGGAPASAPGAAPMAGPAAPGRAGGGRGGAPLQVPSPNYVSVSAQVDVARPVDQVWARIGKYCDIAEWGGFNCQITSGRDGELGAVRTVGSEILVGKTQYSYTYNQPVREGVLYNQYHGTLEARAVGPGATRIFYALIWDNSLVAEANRATDLASRQNNLNRWTANMKILAEGGTVPSPAPRAGGLTPPTPSGGPVVPLRGP